jgi:Holliday junction resolvase-like predicted endonuclease
MRISKSSRHAKITGDFGEALVLYWLSKYGFECAPVDHTGVDIIARNPHTNELMGISVKSRSRCLGTEEECVSIPSQNFEKAVAGCNAFGCAPYFAIVVDAADIVQVYLVSMAHLLELHPKSKGGCYWKMSKAALERYDQDAHVLSFELKTKTKRWWQTTCSAQT